MRKTKIICTLGPATDDLAVLEQLMKEGMNVARLNFSHGTQEEQLGRINAVKAMRAKLNLPVAILLDTRGPEIRIKTFQEGRINLKTGDTFTLTTREIEGDSTAVSVTYSRFPQNIQKGTKILIDDGLVGMEAVEITDTDVVCKVLNGGDLSNRKSINVPGVKIDMEYLNEKDKADIIFGIQNDIDFIAASFVRSKQDLLDIKAVLKQHGAEHIEIISKIENQEGVNKAEEILSECAGIMVARGDLGVEVEFDELPRIQKNLITLCKKHGKKVITATQMLDSMIKNPRPTRAETSDVANAVYDGTSAIMLSGETSVGKYPVDTLKTMVRIAEKAEDNIDYRVTHNDREYNHSDVTSAISHATVSAAHDLNAAKIIAVTTSGYTAQMVSSWRPQVDIVGATTDEKAYYSLALRWGVTPILMERKDKTEELFQEAMDLVKCHGLVKPGDTVVITAGLPIGVKGTTNTLRVATIQ